MPHSSSLRVHTGPTDATATFPARLRRSDSSRPAPAAIASRFGACGRLVKARASIPPCSIRSISASAGPVSAGSPQSYSVSSR